MEAGRKGDSPAICAVAGGHFPAVAECHLSAGSDIQSVRRRFHMLSKELEKPYWLLRVVFGAVPIVAGLDKFTGLLTHWEQYVSPWVTQIVPATTFLHTVGIVEIAAGVLVLSKLTRVGAYVV